MPNYCGVNMPFFLSYGKPHNKIKSYEMMNNCIISDEYKDKVTEDVKYHWNTIIIDNNPR